MKILILIKSSEISGGLEIQNQLLVEGLKELGYEVEVRKTGSPFGDPIKQESAADVVISQSAAGTRLLLSRKSHKPPVVVIQHGTLWGSLKTRVRVGGFSLRLVPYSVKAYILDQLRLRRCEAVIAVSEKVKKDLVREYFLPEKKITVVYNGVPDRGYPSRGVTPRGEKLVVLYLGRLAKEKGLTLLLDAAVNLKSQVSNFRILFVGGGPEFDHLNNRTRELGLDGVVEFVGGVPYGETPKYYQQADAFVLPSIADEGLPMAVLEAMAAGLPVVASKIGGIPEAVIDGETGILVAPGSVEALSQALKKLLTDNELRLKMGQKARQVAEEKFSQEKMVEGVLQCISYV